MAALRETPEFRTLNPFGMRLACPGRLVVVATGDGAFGFKAMEIDTAVRHRAPVLVVVVVANNGSSAIEVRDQQQTHGKVVGTRLQFADHAAMARALGAHGERVERDEDLPAAFARERAVLAAGRPALLDVLVTPEAAPPDAKWSWPGCPTCGHWRPGRKPSAPGVRHPKKGRERCAKVGSSQCTPGPQAPRPVGAPECPAAAAVARSCLRGKPGRQHPAWRDPGLPDVSNSESRVPLR